MTRKTVCFSKAAHFSLGVGEKTVVVRFFGVIDLLLGLKKSGIKKRRHL